MLKIATISTLLAMSAFQVSAQGATDQDFSIGAEAVLPPDVVERIAVLRQYGDRFEKAIRLIEAEALKPHWSSGDCGHTAALSEPFLPES